MDLAKVIGNIESIMASLDKTLGGLKVDEVTQEARMLLAEVRETNRLIQTTIQTTTDAGLLKDASATVAGVRRIVENAEKPVAGSVASLQSAAGRLDRAGKNLGPALERLPKVLDQIQATLQRLDQLAAAPQAGWSESMDNLKTISDNLRKLTEDLRQDPARLLLEPRPGPVRPGGGHGR
jgi:paraquat-inducible protein B